MAVGVNRAELPKTAGYSVRLRCNRILETADQTDNADHRITVHETSLDARGGEGGFPRLRDRGDDT